MKKIKCPECGAEYLPAEIFYPDEFFGKPNSIEKDVYGKLLFFNGKDMNLTETYRCDYCGRKMTINANVSFQVHTQDFNKHNSTKFKKPALFMKEE